MTDLPGNVFNTFVDPVLNGSGTVAFVGKASGNIFGVYKTSAAGLVSVALTGDAAGLIGGSFTTFSSPLINESGLVGFSGTNGASITTPNLPDLKKTGVYTGMGGAPRTLTAIAATGQTGPSLTGAITEFIGSPAMSDNGTVAFKAAVSDANDLTLDPTGIYTGTGGGTATTMNATTIASTTTTAPIGGLFTSFTGSVVQNNVGMSAFSGTSSGGDAIYTRLGSTTTVAATGQAAPVIGGTFSSFAGLALNDQSTVAFTGNSNNGTRAIYTGSGGTLSVTASSMQAAPGLAGNFTSFGDIVLSNTGVVAFRGSVFSAQGVYIAAGGVVQAVATSGQAAPNIGGTFASFSRLALNDLGIVGFIGTNGAGTRGVYLGDGQELITAAYIGQPAAGSTINSLTFAGGADRGGSSQMNNNGQIAYAAVLADGKTSVHLFTPKLRFRNAAGGTWATRSNWTIGILPASVHDVAIDPAGVLTVTGPLLPTTIKSLTVGTGLGLADLDLKSSGIITVTAPAGVTIGNNGKVRGNGRLVGNLTSTGTIAPGLLAAAGSITITGNVTLQPTSLLALDLGGLTRKTAYDCLTVSGAFTLGGNLNVTLLNGFTPLLGNTFDLFDSASTAGTFAALNLPSLTAGLGWNTSLLATTGVISVMSTGPVSATWNLPGSGSWSNSLASNWNPAVPNASGAVATFGTAITALATISVDNAKTVGRMVFNNANSYTIAGGVADVITLADGAGTPEISVTLGSHTISAPVVLGQNANVSAAVGTTLTISGGITGGSNSLTKTGAGTVNLDGPQSYAALNATAGTTTVDGAVGSGSSAVSATGAGTTLRFGTVSQTLSSLTIGAGSTVIFTSGAASFTGGEGKAFGGGAVVPEPGSLGLLLTGVLGLLGRRRR